jgi:hypothetical protein
MHVTCIRPITEYSCPVFHNGLPKFLSNDLERLQKRAMSIIFPQVTYADALAAGKLPTLYDRRNILTVKLFNPITSNENHA